MEEVPFEAVILGGLAIVSIFIVLPGMILHYVVKWRGQKHLSTDQERMLEDMWRAARGMERRIDSLERILDSEAPNWRKTHENQ